MKESVNWGRIIVAGLVAGMAEVVWVGCYALFTEVQASAVAAAISTTVFPQTAGHLLAPWLGLGIHFLLSLGLAAAFGLLVWPLVRRLFSEAVSLVASILTLALVWKVNFFVILPAWNVGFIELLPLQVTFFSKLMFGLAMGLVLLAPAGRDKRQAAA